MISPHDQAPRYAVPVNYETGQELSDRQQLHLGKLKEAAEVLYRAMHDAEGSTVPEHPEPNYEHRFQSRRMSIAATHLETALMFARKAALEAK